MILERNYLDVYPFDKWSDSQIGTFQEQEEFMPTEIKIIPGSTTKPKMLTEADLITLMDNSGIGTDATIHEHIKTILTREYVTKEQGFFYPTTLGMALVMGYEKLDFEIKLSKPELRAMMESNMKLICEGRKTKDEVIKEVLEMYKTAFDDAVEQVDVIVDCFAEFMDKIPVSEVLPERYLEEFVRHCLKCRLEMHLKQTRDMKKFIGCSGFPNCKETVWIPVVVTSITIAGECTRCSVPDYPVKKVVLTFPAGSFGLTLRSPLECCLWCDEYLQEFFNSGRSNPGPSRDTNVNQSHFIPKVHKIEPTERDNPNPITHLNASNANTQKCNCNINASVRTVRKDGPNCGKEFYACSKPQQDDTKCAFFQWLDAPTNEQNCNCQIPCLIRVVRKEGPNFGKEFYACSKIQTDSTRCDYFQWVNQESGTLSVKPHLNTIHYIPPIQSRSEYSEQYKQNLTNDPKCFCGLVSVSLTSTKESTKGRTFFRCVKTSGKCAFFEWSDVNSNGGTESIHPVSIAGNCFKCGEQGHFASSCSKGSSAALVGPASGSCYKCGDKGHFSNACPNAVKVGSNFVSGNCYECGEQGHYSNACPILTTGNSSAARVQGRGAKSKVRDRPVSKRTQAAKPHRGRGRGAS